MTAVYRLCGGSGLKAGVVGRGETTPGHEEQAREWHHQIHGYRDD